MESAPLESNLTQECFQKIVRQAKEYFAAGDVVQIMLSQRCSTPLRHDSFDLYRALRTINHYSLHVLPGLGRLVSGRASPEILVRLYEG